MLLHIERVNDMIFIIVAVVYAFILGYGVSAIFYYMVFPRLVIILGFFRGIIRIYFQLGKNNR